MASGQSPGESHGQKSLAGYTVHGVRRVGHDLATKRPPLPITSWQIDGEAMQTVADFIFLGSKINMDGDYSHEIKRHVLPGRKAMTNLESVLKSRDITLLTKVHIVKAVGFSVVM